MTRRMILPAVALLLAASAPARAASEGWSSNVAESLAKAKAESKHVLMDFTGSDWCGWCIKLNKEVFSQAEFKSQAPQQFVLVELDFPRDKSKLTPETIAQNQQWQQKLGVRGFPTIFLCTAEGEPYAQTGYQAGGPEAYMTHLNELKAMKTEADKLRADAEKAEGVEQAKLYDKLLDMSGKGLIVSDAAALMGKIIELDADGSAGLKNKYVGQQTLGAIMKEMQKGPAGLDSALAKIDAAFAELKPEGQLAQELYFVKSNIQFNKQDKAGALDSLNKALEAAPQGDKAELIGKIKERYFPGQ